MNTNRQVANVRSWVQSMTRPRTSTLKEPSGASTPSFPSRIAVIAAEGVRRVTDLFNTEARQRQRLASLEAERIELLAQHDRAVAAGDDTGLERVAAKLVRNHIDTTTAKTAIDTAQRLAAEHLRIQAEEKRAEVLADVSAAGDAYRELAIEFERNVMALAETWPFIVGAFDVYRVKAQDAKVDHCGSRGLAPGRVWDRVWTQFLGAIKDPTRAPLVMPHGAPVNQNYPSVAESFAKEDRAATASPNLEKESAV